MAPEKNKKGENAAEGSSKPLSSEKGTPKSLKPESKIAKKFRGKKFVNTKKGQGTPQEKGTPQSQGRQGKGTPQSQGRQEEGTPQSQGRQEKGTPQSQGKRRRSRSQSRRRIGAQGKKDGNENEKEGAGKPSLKEGNKEKNIKDEKLIEKKEQNQKEKEKLGGLKKPENNRENGEKHGRMDNRQQYQNNNNKERHGKSVQNERNKEKVGRPERSQENEKKGKVDGLIFMCSAKTKPDCFRHRVMGVPMSKKDVVLGIKPGLKLFLYDFELKLMYGIYKAASSGGLKLEPTAFGGAFPAQVRFDVYKDCYPLPENVFKKAIVQNYNKNNKFDTELTFQQVKKLMDLFKPANTLSNAPPPILSPPVPGYEGGRDFYSNGEMAKEETFLTEKEYRRFGLRGERQTLNPYPDPIYRETAPAPAITPSQREPVSVRHDPILLSEEEYRTYGLGGARRDPPPTVTTETYPKDLYYAYNYGGSGVGGGSSGDPYLPGSSGSYSLGGRRESYVTAASEPEHLRRREDVLYSTYATNALSDYNQMYQQTTQGMTRPEPAPASQMYQQTTQGMTRPELALVPQMYQQTQGMTRPEPALAPVSARYSFAGPSSTYR